jgi:hypothetical protein
LHNHQLHVRLTTSSSPRQIIPSAEPVSIQPKWLVSVQPWYRKKRNRIPRLDPTQYM